MKINTDRNCNIIIHNDVILDPIKQISLFVVQLNKAGVSTNLYTGLTNEDVVTLEPQSQGFISVCQMILPKMNSIEEYDPTENIYVRVSNYIKPTEIEDLINNNDTTYDSEESNYGYDDQAIIGGYFVVNDIIYYKDINGDCREVSVQELLEVDDNKIILYKEIKNFFSVCQLRKCYIALCQKIFNAKANSRCFDNKIDSQLIYRKNLVWSALNVIQYMVDSNQLAEAERLLERISGCNGLCANINISGEDCGCNQ